MVRFEPRGPEDIEAAEQETEVINHIVLEKNDGFLVMYQFFKDALISKNGYVKVYYENKEETEKEFYAGLTDDQFALLMKDSEVEITEHTEYPDEQDMMQRQEAMQQMQGQLQQAMMAAQQGDQQAQQAVQQMQQQLQQLQSQPPAMLHDVRVETTESKGCIEIESIAPEAMMVGCDTPTVSLQDARFVQHREFCTIADLREDGFDVSDDVGMDEGTDRWESESEARDLYGEDYGKAIASGADRMVLVRDTYLKIDGELKRYVVVGNDIILEEDAEIIPFAAITPMIMPHRHIGRSVADLVSDIQLIKSTLMRGQLDGMYLSLNPRTAISERVNLDDMLVSRPGGVVRVQGDVGTAMMPLVTPDVSGIAYPMLEYMDAVKEKRTGVNQQMAGIDPNTLNTTATQANLMQNNAMDRIQLIARIFAETGVKELFRLTHRLMRTHSDKEMVVRLRNKWVTVDPRTWKNRYDMSIAVGLGNGSKDQQLAHLNNLMMVAMNTMQAGIPLVNPKGLYNIVSKMTVNAGFKNPEEFWQDPTSVPPQPPQPNPVIQVEQMKLQADQQKFQAQSQLDQQKAQADAQMTMQLEQLKAQAKLQEVQANLELQAANDARDSEREQNKAIMDAQLAQQRIEFDKWKTEFEAQTKIYIEEMKVRGMPPSDAMAQQNDMVQIMQGLQAVIAQMSAPKVIVRDASGRAIGVQGVN